MTRWASSSGAIAAAPCERRRRIDSAIHLGSSHYYGSQCYNQQSRRNLSEKACKQSDQDLALQLHVCKPSTNSSERYHRVLEGVKREVR